MTQQPTSGDAGAAQIIVKIGDEYAEKERWHIALDLYNEAIKRDSKHANAYYRRGLIYKALEKYLQARKDFDTAIRLGIEHAQIYFHRGYTLYRVIRAVPHLAFNDYDKAIQLDPSYVDAYYWRGQLWFEAEHPERAIEDFTKVIQLTPANGAAYHSRGSAYYEMFNVDNAIADFTYVIENNLYERIFATYYNRAITYQLKDENTLALSDYAEALRIKPDFQMALEGKFELNRRIGQFQEAIEEATKLITLEPENLSYYLKRAKVYERMGEYQKAVNDLTEAIRRTVSFPDVNFDRAEIYVKMGLYSEALADYDYVIDHYPFQDGKQKARDRKSSLVRFLGTS